MNNTEHNIKEICIDRDNSEFTNEISCNFSNDTMYYYNEFFKLYPTITDDEKMKIFNALVMDCLENACEKAKNNELRFFYPCIGEEYIG